MANYRRIGDVAFVDAVTDEDSVMIEHGGDMRRATLDKIKVSDMTGATTDTAGTSGSVPAPSAGDHEKFLKGDGTWGEVKGGGGSVRTVLVANAAAAAALNPTLSNACYTYSIPELYDLFTGNKKFSLYSAFKHNSSGDERVAPGITFVPIDGVNTYFSVIKATSSGIESQALNYNFRIDSSSNTVKFTLLNGTNSSNTHVLTYLEVEVFE
jgi:hypothetical protein